MTSIADYLRALWARVAVLHCKNCGQAVVRDSPSSIFAALVAAAESKQALLCFPCRVGRVSPKALRETLMATYKIVGADGKEYGPVTADILKEWIAQGRVNAQTQVLPSGAADWRPLGDIPELAAGLPIAPPPPLAGSIAGSSGWPLPS